MYSSLLRRPETSATANDIRLIRILLYASSESV